MLRFVYIVLDITERFNVAVVLVEPIEVAQIGLAGGKRYENLL
jgi:hypothetical protein